MKKVLLIILIVILLVVTGCSSTVNNSSNSKKEDFSFQSGLKFGMTKAEFAKHEEDCGAEVRVVFPFFDDVTEGASKVPFANSKYEAYASFQGDSLTSVVYRKDMASSSTKDYYSNKSVMESKYGTSIAFGTKYTILPSLGHTAIDLYESDLLDRMMTTADRWGLKIEDMAQFLVPVKDGYANVFCLLYSFSSQLSFGDGHTYESFVDVYSYSFVPEEAYREMLEKNEKEKNEKLQKQQNDL